MAKYGKSWGSVSSNFTKTTGFQSESKRIAKGAEEQYRKEQQQLSSMKEVAAFNSRAERSAASFADKAAQHELNALSKFSGKLNTFLQGDAAEMYKEAKNKDIKRKIKKIKDDRVEYNKKAGEIRGSIASLQEKNKALEKLNKERANSKEEKDRKALEEATINIAKNNQAVQQLQKDLEAHGLTDPNDPNNVAKLSGNEKIAYYAVTAEEKVKGAEANYHQYLLDHGEATREATWLPKIPGKDSLGNDIMVHPTVKVKDITTPEGKQYLKDEFHRHVMNDMSSQLGGIKEDYRILLLDEPLEAALDKIQATEVQNYKKDKHKDIYNASIQGATNALSGTPPFNAEGSIDAQFNNLYATTRSSFPQSGQGSPGDGLDNAMESMLNTVLNKVDPEKMDDAWENYQQLGNVVLTSGPHAGKTFAEAHPNRWDLDAATKKYAAKRAEVKTKFEQHETGIITGKVAGFKDKLSKWKAEELAKDPPVEVTAAQIKAKELEYYKELYEEHPSDFAGELIFKLQGEQKDSFNDDDWEQEFIALGALHRGTIPTHAVRGIPDALLSEFKQKYNWRVVDQPAAYHGQTATQTKNHHTEIEEAIVTAERNVGQLKSNEMTKTAQDLASDMYEQRLNTYVYDGDPDTGRKLTPIEAGQRARREIIQMIQGEKLLEDDSPNPLYAGQDPGAKGPVNAWRGNKAVNLHLSRNKRLPSGPAELEWTTAQDRYQKLKEVGPVKLEKTFLFTAPKLNEAGEVQNIEEITKLLGDGLGHGKNDGGHVVTETYKRVSRREAGNRGQFLHKQRIAILSATSVPPGDPRKSTLHTTHPELVKAWFTAEDINKPLGSVLADRAAYVQERADQTAKAEKEENEKNIRIQKAKKDKRSAKERAQDNLNESNSYSGVSLNF